ncbi:MAG: biopolymer transporter ExbD, partial [Planctomycetales bacterium]
RRPIPKVSTNLHSTSMIDIVFLLLVFFIMTFRVVAQEGDFTVRMPVPGKGQPDDIAPVVLPLKIRLTAESSGELRGITLGDQSMRGFDEVRTKVKKLVGAGAATELEVELQCDQGLNYLHVIEAITAVSGYRDAEGRVVGLIKKVRFSPPQRP